ncbi:MAG: hypothetical protein OCC49_14260 [Fibrobacterales bacterium]
MKSLASILTTVIALTATASVAQELHSALPAPPNPKNIMISEAEIVQADLLKKENLLIAEERQREIERLKRKKEREASEGHTVDRATPTFVDDAKTLELKEYEVTPTIGLYISFGDVDYQKVSYTDYTPTDDTSGTASSFDLTSSSHGTIFGISGNLPINNLIGIQLVIGGQKSNLSLQSGTHNRDISMLNLIIQPGIEIGYPVYTNTKSNISIYPHLYGSGITGKTFLDQSATDFENGQFWGYAYGAGVRIGWNNIHISGGVRSSYQIWKLAIDPVKIKGTAGLTENDYTFMHEWSTFMQPFMSVTLGFY